MLRSGNGSLGVEIIGGFKLVKAVLLIVAAILLPIVGRHQAPLLFWLAQHLSVDPNAHFFRQFVQKFAELSPKIPLISIGMGFYGGVFAVEGVGLLRRKHWAEYLTIIVTASFLPLEIYEIVRHTTLLKAIVIALNCVILVYLWLRVRARRHEKGSSSVPNTFSSSFVSWLRKSGLSRARRA